MARARGTDKTMSPIVAMAHVMAGDVSVLLYCVTKHLVAVQYRTILSTLVAMYGAYTHQPSTVFIAVGSEQAKRIISHSVSTMQVCAQAC